MNDLINYLEYDHKTISGQSLTDYQVQRLNRIIKEENNFIKEGLKVPEYLKNEFHHFYKMCDTLNKEI